MKSRSDPPRWNDIPCRRGEPWHQGSSFDRFTEENQRLKQRIRVQAFATARRGTPRGARHTYARDEPADQQEQTMVAPDCSPPPNSACSTGPGPRVCPRRCAGTPRCRDGRLSYSAGSRNSLPRYSGGSEFALLILGPGQRSPHAVDCTCVGIAQGDRSLTSFPLPFQLHPTGQQGLCWGYFQLESWEQAMRMMSPSMVRLGCQNSQCDEPADCTLVFPAGMTLR